MWAGSEFIKWVRTSPVTTADGTTNMIDCICNMFSYVYTHTCMYPNYSQRAHKIPTSTTVLHML